MAKLEVTTGSLASRGEAYKVFREEFERSLKLIFERYERNLRREAISLGLSVAARAAAQD